MPNELIPMSTWTPKDGQTYEIVDKDARERLDDAEERLDDLEQGGGGGTASGTVKSVNNVEPDASGNVTLSASDVHALPDSTVIPAAVTEQTVSGWGFTKNTGTYSKPSGGIPASDLAAGVIPVVPQMADDYVLDGMDDWTAGKTVDAATLKDAMNLISQGIASKADAYDIPIAVSDLTNDSGYQTAQQVQAAISPLQPKAITDTGGYFTTDTVEGALQEIGAELSGINALIGSGVIS